MCVCVCGIMQTTWRSGWTVSEVLQLFSGNFQITRPGRTASEACLLVFRHYIINECRDVIYDIMAPHVHRSRDLLL